MTDIQVYCLKCKQNNIITEQYTIIKTNNANQLKGVCSVCENKVCKFLKKDDPLVNKYETNSKDTPKPTSTKLKSTKLKSTKLKSSKDKKKIIFIIIFVKFYIVSIHYLYTIYVHF